jgi:hypothetical protein
LAISPLRCKPVSFSARLNHTASGTWGGLMTVDGAKDVGDHASVEVVDGRSAIPCHKKFSRDL